MNFVRVKKRGQDQRSQKTWMPEGSLKQHTYRITWAREVHGVSVKPHYHATVWSFRNMREEVKQWDFAGRRGPYKTFEAAVEACVANEKAWLALIDASNSDRTGRNDRMRTIEYRSRLKYIKDKKPAFQKTMTSLPAWAAGKVNNILVSFIFPVGKKRTDEECDEEPAAPSGPSETSVSSEDTSSITSSESGGSAQAQTSNGLASDVTAADASTTQPQSASTKRGRTKSSAKTAAATAKEPKKRSKRSTKDSLDAGDVKPTPTTKPKPSAKVPRKNSPRKSVQQ